jgi:hypothetical protein
MRLVDLTGRRFGRLTVLGRVPGQPGRVSWLCACDCGGIAISLSNNLARGDSQSCGCLRSEQISERAFARNKARITHGLSKTPEYAAWWAMRERCQNPEHPAYEHYGGRGISVCKEWAESFETFFAYVGRRPSDEHSLDRINNDGNYEPGNVRWATIDVQNSNKRYPRRKRHEHHDDHETAPCNHRP